VPSNANRPILPGQNENEFVPPWRDSPGVYSYFPIWSSTQLLEDMPINKHVPGEGRHPHGLQMSRWFLGLQNDTLLGNPGLGTRIDGMRFNPTLFRGLVGALEGTSGQSNPNLTYSRFTNFVFHGLEIDKTLVDPGHSARGVDGEGTAATFGSFGPLDPGAKALFQPMEDPGQALPEGYDNSYGHNRIQEWHGVPSARVL
jgi:hypothetical protein